MITKNGAGDRTICIIRSRIYLHSIARVKISKVCETLQRIELMISKEFDVNRPGGIPMIESCRVFTTHRMVSPQTLSP